MAVFGTLARSRVTMQVFDDRSPILASGGSKMTPSWRASRMKQEIPFGPRAGSLVARQMKNRPTSPLVIHALAPSSRQWSPSSR